MGYRTRSWLRTHGTRPPRKHIALVVPGGVDRSGEYRVIPALLALLERLSRRHDVEVFALAQDAEPADWRLVGAHIHNVGRQGPRLRAILARHRARHFDVV